MTLHVTKYQSEEDYTLYKVLVVGDAEAGKTSAVGSFTGDYFNPTYTPTIGVDFRIHTIELDEFRIKLQLLDTAGMPYFRTAKPSFYRWCAGYIIMYNATKEETFENVPSWIEEISRYAHPDAKIVLVGTNGDRVDEKVVDYTRARDFASERQIPSSK
jgi:small GTP-binding protein